VESYGFHALEVLQCMVERRAGGESGVVAVQCIEGSDIWAARDQGRWPADLAEAAVAAIAAKPRGNLTTAQVEALEAMEKGSMEESTIESRGPAPGHADNTALFVIEYADGFRGYVLMLPGFVSDFAYAARTTVGIEACVFNLHAGGTSSHFSWLARNIERFFTEGVAPYPGKLFLDY
jgi:hypothetical protein